MPVMYSDEGIHRWLILQCRCRRQGSTASQFKIRSTTSSRSGTPLQPARTKCRCTNGKKSCCKSDSRRIASLPATPSRGAKSSSACKDAFAPADRWPDSTFGPRRNSMPKRLGRGMTANETASALTSSPNCARHSFALSRHPFSFRASAAKSAAPFFTAFRLGYSSSPKATRPRLWQLLTCTVIPIHGSHGNDNAGPTCDGADTACR